jgi:hypothetical protein
MAMDRRPLRQPLPTPSMPYGAFLLRLRGRFCSASIVNRVPARPRARPLVLNLATTFRLRPRAADPAFCILKQAHLLPSKTLSVLSWFVPLIQLDRS